MKAYSRRLSRPVSLSLRDLLGRFAAYNLAVYANSTAVSRSVLVEDFWDRAGFARLGDLTPAALNDWLIREHRAGKAPYRLRGALRAFYRFLRGPLAMDIPDPTDAPLQWHQKRAVALRVSPEQVAALAAAARSPLDAALVGFLTECGLGLGAQARLTVGDVGDWGLPIKRRLIPFSGGFATAVRACKADRLPDCAFFPEGLSLVRRYNRLRREAALGAVKSSDFAAFGRKVKASTARPIVVGRVRDAVLHQDQAPEGDRREVMAAALGVAVLPEHPAPEVPQERGDGPAPGEP